MVENNPQPNEGYSTIGAVGGADSPLGRLLLASEIAPGSPVGYETAKIIYAYHPLGPVLTDEPITLAQSQEREINIPVLGERRLIEQFEKGWKQISRIGASKLLHNLHTTARIYGIASLAIVERGKDPSKPLDVNSITLDSLFFNVLDPLNTSGSLVLNQDPNSPDFLKTGQISVRGQSYHPSRTIVAMNEQPIYIEWTPSAYGFVGRSVYQRCLYPLKSFVQTMVTDDMVTKKAGLLVYKGESQGSFMDKVSQAFAGIKRQTIKGGHTGQVLQIGKDEAIETLNMMNLDKAYTVARSNLLRNIASACGMPASIITKETLAEGFGEGSEDAKEKGRYIDVVRSDMQPSYQFMDKLVMRCAWTPDFYEAFQVEYPDYADKPYETALHEWMNAFVARWPNYLIEPDSERSKTADVQFKAVVAFVETIAPELDPTNKANLIMWAADNANEREELFAAKLDLDLDSLTEFLEEKKERESKLAEAGAQNGAGEKEPGEPPAFSGRS
jgi:Protein of unknown function (DUF1073)